MFNCLKRAAISGVSRANAKGNQQLHEISQ